MMIDRQGDPATEAAVAELIAIGEIRRHTRKVLKIYGERRALIAQLLRDQFGGLLEFELPDGGLAVWVRFGADIDLARLAELARHERVHFLPGSAFSITAQRVAGARLGFASLDAGELRRATQRLRAALAKLR
jgi:GntR family transcriptional regulator/MocR family aminotransferase